MGFSAASGLDLRAGSKHQRVYNLRARSSANELHFHTMGWTKSMMDFQVGDFLDHTRKRAARLGPHAAVERLVKPFTCIS